MRYFSRQRVKLIGDILKQRGLRGSFDILKNMATLVSEPEIVRSRPLIIQVEPTINCNLKCSGCVSPLMKIQKKALSLGEFKHILTQFPSVQKISLVGAGEPLMNPELFDIIDFAKKSGKAVGFATNATLMNKKVSEMIVSSKTDWLNISLDGATKETYEKIRIGSDFGEVIKNVKTLVKSLGRQKKPEVSIWFLTMRDNIIELPGLIELAKQLGIQNVCVQSTHYWGRGDIKQRILQERVVANDTVRIKHTLNAAAIIAKKYHIGFSYVNIPDKNSERACQWPWRSCYITVEGYVTPCCLHGASPELINFGNIFTEDFEKIWNNSSIVSSPSPTMPISISDVRQEGRLEI